MVGTWRTKNGTQVKIAEMSDLHLINALTFVQAGKVRLKHTCSILDGEDSCLGCALSLMWRGMKIAELQDEINRRAVNWAQA